MQIKPCLKYLNKHKIILIIFAILCCIFIFITSRSKTLPIMILPYPAGYNFAFTITDDPDDGWLEEKKVVYDFLSSIGLKISAGVWVFDNKTGSGETPYYHQGISLENEELLKYTLALKNRGFEIFLHTVSGGNDTREDTIKGFEIYKKYFNKYPHHWINHWTNYEDIYWGYKRFNNPLMKKIYQIKSKIIFQGDNPDSDYFWGDYCKKYIKYVRGWATNKLNTISVNPGMPYYDSEKPCVNYWYGCSDGANVDRFNKLITRQNVDNLIREKGTAIIYTHFAKGFVDKKGRLNTATKELLTYVSQHKDGWFVPVNIILDRFLALRKINIFENSQSYFIVNSGKTEIKNLSIEVNDISGVIWKEKIYKFNKKPAKLIIEKLTPGVVITLEKVGGKQEANISFKEKFFMALGWIRSR